MAANVGSRFVLLSFAAAFGFVAASSGAKAACEPELPRRLAGASVRLADPIARALAAAPECPKDVMEFRTLLKQNRMTLDASLVGNRGLRNPKLGSFSAFETADGGEFGAGRGDVFFGHFTTIDSDDRLALDQSPSSGSLMIEAFAWDPVKGWYNFYELRGDGQRGQWQYRGDSADVWADVEFLHRQPNPAAPRFGDRLRCSGCHVAGGPIMKELAPPHNDWWTAARPLDFAGRAFDPRLAEVLASLSPASRLAEAVRAGSEKLEASASFQALKKASSLQERLRPLFCPVEINFESDLRAGAIAARLAVRAPASFFVDPILLRPLGLTPAPISFAREAYERALTSLGSSFPETAFADGDHAFLAPVKAHSDRLAIDALIASGLIDEEFAADVIAVDAQNPALSNERCGLLRLVPEAATDDWPVEFRARLRASRLAAASELERNLSDPSRTKDFHANRALLFLNSCQEQALKETNAEAFVRLLDQRRSEIRASEISKNPRGQILEPGFRVIFPALARPVAPGSLRLSAECLPQ